MVVVGVGVDAASVAVGFTVPAVGDALAARAQLAVGAIVAAAAAVVGVGLEVDALVAAAVQLVAAREVAAGVDADRGGVVGRVARVVAVAAVVGVGLQVDAIVATPGVVLETVEFAGAVLATRGSEVGIGAALVAFVAVVGIGGEVDAVAAAVGVSLVAFVLADPVDAVGDGVGRGLTGGVTVSAKAGVGVGVDAVVGAQLLVVVAVRGIGVVSSATNSCGDRDDQECRQQDRAGRTEQSWNTGHNRAPGIVRSNGLKHLELSRRRGEGGANNEPSISSRSAGGNGPPGASETLPVT